MVGRLIRNRAAVGTIGLVLIVALIGTLHRLSHRMIRMQRIF